MDVKLNVAPTQAFAGDPHLNSYPSLPRSQWGPQDRVPLYLTFVKNVAAFSEPQTVFKSGGLSENRL